LAILLAWVNPRWREVAVQVDEGTLFVDLREASSHGLFGGQPQDESERGLLRRCVGRGQVVLDIGAHWGLYTVQLASQVGPEGEVFALEPCPTVLPCLKRTVGALPNVVLFPVAVSDTASTASLVVPLDASMASLANWTDANRGLRKYAIETVRLDDLLCAASVRPADFVKCDVEGAEALVFRGATTLLNRPDAPVVMLEVNARASAALGLASTAALDVLANLEAAQYQFYALGGAGRLIPLSRPPERAWNIFAVPAQRPQWLESAAD
jgi:FkbM family methyltransferase